MKARGSAAIFALISCGNILISLALPKPTTINHGRLHSQIEGFIATLLVETKCMALFVASDSDMTTGLIRFVSDCFSDVNVIGKEPILKQIQKDGLVKPKSRSPNCYITWANVHEPQDVSAIVNGIFVAAMKQKVQSFPKLSTDRFIFYTHKPFTMELHRVLGNDKVLRTTITRIRYGIALYHNNGNLNMLQLCGRCPVQLIGKSATASVRQLFVDTASDSYGAPLRISYPTTLDFRVKMVRDTSNQKYQITAGAFRPLSDILCQKLNFTPVYLPSSNKGATGSRLKNGTWTGATGDIIYDRADLAVTLIVSQFRIYVLDFSFPLEYWSITFTTPVPAEIFTWTAILQPFSYEVYAAIVASAILMVGSFSFANFLTQRRVQLLQNQERRNSNLNGNVYSSCNRCVKERLKTMNYDTMVSYVEFFLGSFLLQSVPLRQNSRLLSSLWFLTVIVLSTAYLSKLFYFMAFPTIEHVPSTFEELANSDYEWTLWSAGGQTYRFFQRGTAPAYKIIFAKMSTDPNANRCLRSALRKRRACILYTGMAEFDREAQFSDKFGRTGLRIASEKTEPMLASIGMPKGSPLRDKIDRVTQPLMEGRIFAKYVQEDIQRRRHERLFRNGYSSDDDMMMQENAPFLGNLIGAFYIILAGICVCVVQGAAEIIYFNLKRKAMGRERIAQVVWIISGQKAGSSGNARPIQQTMKERLTKHSVKSGQQGAEHRWIRWKQYENQSDRQHVANGIGPQGSVTRAKRRSRHHVTTAVHVIGAVWNMQKLSSQGSIVKYSME